MNEIPDEVEDLRFALFGLNSDRLCRPKDFSNTTIPYEY